MGSAFAVRRLGELNQALLLRWSTSRRLKWVEPPLQVKESKKRFTLF